ncbi:MAG: cytochrome c3 family protein [Solidesulfovibrio sp.]
MQAHWNETIFRKEKHGALMKKSLFVAAICLIGTITWASSYTIKKTSTTEFCLSCHEMETHGFELKRSSHAVDKDKNPISCVQCHMPPDMGLDYLVVKSYLGVRDAAVHLFGDTQDLDRRGMQLVARRFVTDANCQACHADLMKNVKGLPISPEGKKAHEAWLGKDGNARRSCAGCHTNMAHLPIFDRRYAVNTTFVAKLPPQGE